MNGGGERCRWGRICLLAGLRVVHPTLKQYYLEHIVHLCTRAACKLDILKNLTALSTFMVLLGLPRCCSASGMFAEARVDSFYALMRKRCGSLVRRVRGSVNSILNMISNRLDCIYMNRCRSVANGTVQRWFVCIVTFI